MNSNSIKDDISNISKYVATQLNNIFPEISVKDDTSRLQPFMAETLNRLDPILKVVRNFQSAGFNKYNSLQYSTFLYLLSNEVWVKSGDVNMVDRLFLLNRALNSLDLFYKVKMPKVFFLSHAIGSVLGNVEFGENLVIFQNVTVGRVGLAAPKIGDNVVLYPGSSVTGNSVIGNNSVIGAGVSINNVTVPDDTVVVNQNGVLVFKKRMKDFVNLYFKYD